MSTRRPYRYGVAQGSGVGCGVREVWLALAGSGGKVEVDGKG